MAEKIHNKQKKGRSPKQAPALENEMIDMESDRITIGKNVFIVSCECSKAGMDTLDQKLKKLVLQHASSTIASA